MNSEWSGLYDTALQLLKHLQSDYHFARKELHDVSTHFGEREAAASMQLQSALNAMDEVVVDRGYRTSSNVCLERLSLPFVLEAPVSRPPTFQSKPMLEVYCLGRFQVRINWEMIDQWNSNKAKSLLKYLVAQQGRPVSKDLLMEALWPGFEPSLANNNLKAGVRALRQTLSLTQGNDDFTWVLYQDGCYLLNPEADLWVDVEQFEYHWQTARQLEKDGKLAESHREHKMAEALYKGDYLEDDLYEEWTTLRREALKDIYLATVGRLADTAVNSSDYERCIDYCQKILSKDPCRDDAYRRLMCCYSRLGQRNRAVSWYRLCEKNVRKELDTDPEPQTVALYNKLLDGEYI